MATLADIITRVQELLSLAGGLNVQTYAQPRIVQFVTMGYNTLYKKRFWKDYTKIEMFTLDGLTGRVTADLSAKILKFSDIQYVWYQDYATPLPIAPENRTPDMIRQLSFGPSGVAACPFTVFPITNSGNIWVAYRTKAIMPFTETYEIPMDDELLVRWAAMMYLTFDNANQAAIQLITKMYSDYLNELEKLEDNHSKSLYSYTAQTVNEWHDA